VVVNHGSLILCSLGIAGRRPTMRGRATGGAIALATSPSRPTNSLVILLKSLPDPLLLAASIVN
jgi:hypothetical protein